MYLPKLWITLKNYNKNLFINDLTAGVIVAIIALPLSIALALASGVGPENGLYTAIVAGFVIAAFGGSSVQVSGPTAAFATIVASIVASKGLSGLAIATCLAGIILIIMGLLKLGQLIKYIPYTIVTGFTAGIACTIVIGQLKNFFGLSYTSSSIHTLGKLSLFLQNISTINYSALMIGLLALAILIVWPKINAKIPGSLIALIITIALTTFFPIDVKTIGSSYSISNSLPTFHFLNFNLDTIMDLLPDAITIAILASIESLLSAVVSDGMIGDKHDSNAELIGQGLGNIASSFMGGIPATGAIARTAANVKSNGRTPIAAMIHAIVLILILVIFMPYAALIPMPTIAAILLMVAYNMSGLHECKHLCKVAPKSDTFILLVTFTLTVIFDLVIAIEIGLVMTSFLFIKRMSDASNIRRWQDQTSEQYNYLKIPDNTLIYEVDGPMFFAATDMFYHLTADKNTKVIIIRMRNVLAMDISALKLFSQFIKQCQNDNITILISHICKQPFNAMEKANLVTLIGEDNFLENINDAIKKAKELLA